MAALSMTLVTSDPDFNVMTFVEVEYLRDNVTIAH